MSFTTVLNKQDMIATYIFRFLANTQKLGQEKLTLSLYETRIELLERYWNTFQSQHATLMGCDEYSTSIYATTNVYEQVEEEYVRTKTVLRDRIKELSLDSTPKQGSPGSAQARLPEISLPKFSGDYLAWENFRDLFISLVHQAPGLSDATRLQYLKASLTGEAAMLLSATPVTDANYKGAWSALVERFECKRLLMTHHFRRLFSFRSLTVEAASNIKLMLDTFEETRRALETLGRQRWEDWFVFLMVEKLPPTLRKEWENSLPDRKYIPTSKELHTFLINRISTMETITPSRSRSKSHASNTRRFEVRANVTNAGKPSPQSSRKPTPNQQCSLCKGPHFVGKCAQYLPLNPTQRRDTIRKLNLCINCLRQHPTASCPSVYRCRLCQAEHHTTLHPDDAGANPSTSAAITSTHVQTVTANNIQPVLLATALVRVTASSGNSARVRALLDQGSEATFISEDLVQRLQLPRTRVHIPVLGIGATRCATVKAQVQVQLSSINGSIISAVTAVAYVLPHLTRAFRPRRIDTSLWPHLQGIQLSDQGLASPHKIDLVIGADFYGDILRDGLLRGSPGTPIAQNTIFGWVISGRGTVDSKTGEATTTLLHCSVDLSLMDALKKFWELEELPQHPPMSPEEQKCEDEFKQTHSRAADGRFIVRLPRRSGIPLGNSYATAIRSLHRGETQRQRDHLLDEAYRTFMKEYLDLGHMSPLNTATPPDCCFLPHHAVWKTDGHTSKIRVVFNASAPTSSGYTLNDSLLSGPTLQQELSHVLLRWRKHAIVFTTDIVKMFRQIWVHPEDRHLQTILWRDSTEDPIQKFQLNTVTYGTACAPYLAIRCLFQLATEEAERFPEAAKVIRTQTYVDDILAGADNLEDAHKLKNQLRRLLMAGGFQLSKWAANSADILETDPSTHHLNDGSVRALGLHWHTKSDSFRFRVTLEPPTRLTKRTILSCIAKLFDPLGWLAPVLIRAKLFLQDLWTIKVDWDITLPSALEESWSKYYSSLIQLEEVRIPRWIGFTSNCHWELHGFCDASQRAYAAVIYIRVLNTDGTSRASLLTAKTKIAPIKAISLPRLELCGAVLLARLLRQVEDLLQGATKVYAWTDSQVVLCWLQDHPSRWKTFVANRTSEIHQLMPQAIWNHVPSSDNAADPASRGITPAALLTDDLWWHGPSWLTQPNTVWPKSSLSQPTAAVREEEKTRALMSLAIVTSSDELQSLQKRYSSLQRLIRTTAWILRFTANSKTAKDQRVFGPLTTTELNNSRNLWVRINQQESFAPEIALLRTQREIKKGSSLYYLRPFLDEQGLLRVGGRLEQGSISYDEKHPFILPSKCYFSKLLATDAHYRTLHGGPQLVQSLLCRHYWILRGRSMIKGIVRSCIRCFRYNAKPEKTMMGILPATRITPSRPFLHTGLDYAGPIQLKISKGRGRITYKGYIALFVCMATKAIHLEAVSDYTSASFLAAFKRFCSRRGIPATISSDQATNFQGAKTKLRHLLDGASQENQRIAELLANDGTQWKFIPPHSPHFGGLWEAGVKSVKYHLRRTIGDIILTFEELTTILAEVEACLNSRPLTPLSSDPEDYAALTPGHFLIGTALKNIPEPSLLQEPLTQLDRWQLLRRLYEQFWRRWSSEYLHQLQQRTKWNTTTPNLQIGELVLIKEDNLTPSKWSLGRVTALHPGPDGIIRVVTIKTARTERQRPIVKLCRLPSQ